MNDQTPIKAGAQADNTEVLSAIAAAMGQIKQVGKGDRNKFDGYDFASIDKFLALVNPICAAHGLIIVSDEVNREDFMRRGKKGDTQWMRVTFSFTVYHSSGQSLPQVHRSVEVARNGAQAYGSAQSYALKQFLRGLFLIPTGDNDDADHMGTDDGAVIVGPTQKATGSAHAKSGGDDDWEPTEEAIEFAKAKLRQAQTMDALRSAWSDLSGKVKSNGDVIEAKDTRKKELEGSDTKSPSPSIAEDEIPY